MIQEPTMTIKERYDEDDYDDMLDEVYGSIEIAGHSYSTSYALREVDPIAYNCGFSDFQEEYEVWICPICEDEYEDDEGARWCCQVIPTCSICGEEYETEWEAETCCEEEEDEL